MATGSVGLFDSGVGGLSVLAEVRTLLPDEDLWYLADQSHAPYGERTLDQVRQRSLAVADHLIGGGAKAVVVACNSASAAALSHLRATFPTVPFIGMEPAVKPAAAATRGKVIGVLATQATFQGELFASLVDRHGKDVAVVARACPGLAQAVEDLDLDDHRLAELLASYVRPVLARGADVLVLGCTHYAFLSDLVADIAGPRVQVIDPAPAVAKRLADVLAGAGLVGPPGNGRTRFETTGDPAVFGRQVERLLAVQGVCGEAVTIGSRSDG